ncbi:MAG TPA: universal stress protein [Steroidobacter sp.]|uniref:universal stress protein n=1 Tax=Steroidobacter sp. TaxID=1978227 RepID=UPI002ED96434
MYKNILIAVDGSSASERGLAEGLRLAKATGGKVILLHVVNALLLESEAASTAYFQALAESFQKQGEEILGKAAAAAREAGVAFEQKLVVKIGALASDEIVAVAKSSKVDLIVIGTHGRRGLKRVVMGSDAELVLRQSPVPVLMVREQADSK